MKNIICVKEIPDPQDIGIYNGKIGFDNPELIMNPFDEYAVEEAICLSERFGYSSISLTLGGNPSVKAVKTAVALGVEDAIEILSDRQHNSASSGDILAKMVGNIINKEEKIGLIIVGRQSIDQAKGQVGSIIAEQLNLPYVTNVVEIIDLNQQETKIKRKDESGYQILRALVPCVIQVSGGEINEPRTPTLKGLLKARKYVAEIVKVNDVLTESATTSSVGGSIRTLYAELPPARKKGTILEGQPQEQVDELIKRLESIFQR
jgi:electron transfer flavoprotein beta subunit